MICNCVRTMVLNGGDSAYAPGETGQRQAFLMGHELGMGGMGEEVRYWYLVSGGQGCYFKSYNAQNSLHNKQIPSPKCQ